MELRVGNKYRLSRKKLLTYFYRNKADGQSSNHSVQLKTSVIFTVAHRGIQKCPGHFFWTSEVWMEQGATDVIVKGNSKGYLPQL